MVYIAYIKEEVCLFISVRNGISLVDGTHKSANFMSFRLTAYIWQSTQVKSVLV